MDKFKAIDSKKDCGDDECDCCRWKDYEDIEDYSPDTEDYDTEDDIYEHTPLTGAEKIQLLKELSSLEEREVTSSLPDMGEEVSSIFFKVSK